ncbi:unnamed protein product [Cuscuta europaea]|uniref:Uncharacterized protein n=1 Tax=Cuscuta europaea TaxID=41803 RepID=A0A9P0YSK2_CUSEU|nr:unnamed protein product [Cuscuta europaea]
MKSIKVEDEYQATTRYYCFNDKVDMVKNLYSQDKGKGGFDEGCDRVMFSTPTEGATSHTKPLMQKKKKAVGGCATCGAPTHNSSMKCRLHRNRWASAPLKITGRRPGSVDDCQLSQFTRFGRAILKSFQF